jgi:GNAT superfamily N-acetyltransferase
MYIYIMIAIRTAEVADASLINTLAEITWHSTYLSLLGAEQVLYMLDLFYNIPKLEKQIATGEQVYLLLSENDKVVAFAAFAPRDTNPDVYKLHKLYCLDEAKGKGYGKALVEEVERRTLDAGLSVLELNVNRYNPTLDFYKKSGFEIIYEEDIDIGNGYWMNDYVMRKALN